MVQGRGVIGAWVVAWSLVATVAAIGCSQEEPATSTGTASGKDTVDAAADTPMAEDTGSSLASCTGSALQPSFSSKDGDCNFLTKCPSLGECYCGDKCPANKAPKCDASICPTTSPKCYCGEQCGATQKKCPQYICDPLDEKACVELDDCVFNTAKRPEWCGCQTMPPHKPDCWCNANKCAEPHPECEAAKCAGKPVDKCIFVKGDDYDGCWCDRCGMLGETPKCFFVLCP